jgi:hypothetical protein
MFRCTEYIERREPRLSHSGIMNFIRCPMMYYYSNVMGLQLKGAYQSDPLKIGSAVDDYVTNLLLGGEPTGDTVYLNGDIDCMWKAKAIGIIRAFKELINIKKVAGLYTGQHKFDINKDGQPQIIGFIDLHALSGKRFIELKTGKNPNYYTNLFYIRSKLAAYFMSSEEYETGTMWAIRVPDLKRTGKFKNEPFPDYAERIKRVMIAEPANYFPGYNSKARNFGVKFGRAEFDLEKEMKKYRMVADYMKLAVKKDLWLENGTGCLHPFECDYLHVCQNNGAVSEDVFTYRKKESGVKSVK